MVLPRRVRELCQANTRPGLPLELRRAAHGCLLQMAATEGGIDAALEAALTSVDGLALMQLRYAD